MRILYHLPLSPYARKVRLALTEKRLPFELRLEPGPAAYAVNWPTVTLNPEQHLGYAVQWFSLAAALLVLFVYLGIRHAQETRHASSRHPD